MKFIILKLLTGRRAMMLGITLGTWLTMQAASCGRQPHPPPSTTPKGVTTSQPSGSGTENQMIGTGLPPQLEKRLQALVPATSDPALNPDNLRALSDLLGVSDTGHRTP